MSIQTAEEQVLSTILRNSTLNSRVENGNVAKSLNFKGSLCTWNMGRGTRTFSRIILRLRSRVRLRQPGRAMETSRHSGSGADLKWMVRDCEEVEMLKSVQLCNAVKNLERPEVLSVVQRPVIMASGVKRGGNDVHRGILVHYDDYDDHNSGKFKV